MRNIRHPRSATFAEIPDWVKPATPDVPGFFSAICLASLEGQWFRLRVADQRALLGCAPFGKSALRSDGASVTITRTVCFGTDWDEHELHAAELAARIGANLTARPGVYGALRK